MNQMFLLGDVVRKIGETQRMTVDVLKPGRVQTCWLDEAVNFRRGEFAANDLELVPPDEDESFWDDEDWEGEDEEDESFEEDDEGEDESCPDLEDDMPWEEEDFDGESDTPADGIATEPVVEA